MGLPQIPLPRETVTLPDGSQVEVRGLSRAEVLRIGRDDGDLAAGEVKAIALATGFPENEVRDWHETAPFGVVQMIVDAVTRLSGTDQESGKGSAEA